MLPDTVTAPPEKRPLSVPTPVSRSSVPPPPLTWPTKAQPASTTRVSAAFWKPTATPPAPSMVPKLVSVLAEPVP